MLPDRGRPAARTGARGARPRGLLHVRPGAREHRERGGRRHGPPARRRRSARVLPRVPAHRDLRSRPPRRPARRTRRSSSRWVRGSGTPSSCSPVTCTAPATCSSRRGSTRPGRKAVVAATLVEELGQPALRYFVLWLQSTLALIDGQFEDAEKLAHESFELGVAANHPDSAVVYGTQLVVFAWQRGDTTELVEPTLDILDAGARPSRLAFGARARPRARRTPRRGACRADARHRESRQPHVHVHVDTGADRAHRGRPPARRARAWRPGCTRVSPPTPTA